MEVETRALKTDYEELEACLEKSKLELDALSVGLTELSKMWSGTTNKTFSNRLKIDLQEMQGLLKNMENVKEKFLVCGISYEKNEWKGKELIESVTW